MTSEVIVYFMHLHNISIHIFFLSKSVHKQICKEEKVKISESQSLRVSESQSFLVRYRRTYVLKKY